LFGKRGEFKWLAIPSHRGQHLGVACYAAIAAEEHQFSDHARLHRALQAQEAAGYGNYLQLRGASDAAGKPYHHRGFFFESDTLRPFTKLSLGGVGHELSITILMKNREITEGQKSYQHSAKIDVIAPKASLDGQFAAKAKVCGWCNYNYRQRPKQLGPDFGEEDSKRAEVNAHTGQIRCPEVSTVLRVAQPQA
jgi:hypothetical protein